MKHANMKYAIYSVILHSIGPILLTTYIILKYEYHLFRYFTFYWPFITKQSNYINFEYEICHLFRYFTFL